ncbi:MAG TPA: peptidoglycan DD-metalloendopeptidase family protein [Actinomycetota bacterium]|nr:peptidoglycan DD-metalloendopeptidase family protein [Actinomycetota bacterium]
MPSPKRSFVVLSTLVCALLLGSAAPALGAAFPPQMPSPEEVKRLQAEVAASSGKLSQAQKELDRLVAAFEAGQTALETLQNEIGAAEARIAELEAQTAAVQGSINKRASSNYRSGPTELLNVLLGARTFRQLATAMDLFESVTSSDSKTLQNIRQLREETARLKTELDAKRVAQQQAVEALKKRQRDMQGSLAALARQYESVKTRLDTSKAGFSFPVKAPYSFVDTYLAPRAGYRRHQGVDIFALSGTPVYAVVNGVVEEKGVNPLGGNKLWIRSPGDNWRYYYAHLSGYGPGISNGTRVKKGQVIGYVGNTGNARTTPPHLHFETHVPSGAAVNPYPILKRVNLIK